jgi:[DsrC]-trisulfide reductase subunit J
VTLHRLALGGFVLALVTLIAPALGADRVAKPVIEIAQPGKCVEDTATMRRDHPDLLRIQRDLTVREGVRTQNYSLKGCVSCHAAKQTGSVLGQNGFCQSCHDYVGVKTDCFECHSPERSVADGAKP